MREIVLFDFDGTIIKGDSTKWFFKAVFNSKWNFYKAYYFKHLLYLFIFFVTKDYSKLKESRRVYIADWIEKYGWISFDASNLFFQNVLDVFLDHSNSDKQVIIISAGYYEIIEKIMPVGARHKIIANSLFEASENDINFENKVCALNQFITEPYRVSFAYGNSSGDLPMLDLAENSFLIDKSGKINNSH